VSERMDVETLAPLDALEFALSRARAFGAGQADAIYGDDDSLSVDLFEGRVKNVEKSRSAGLGLRVLVDGRPGYSFTERLTVKAVERCVRDAVDLSKLTDELPVELPSGWTLPPEEIAPWGERIAGLGVETMIELCRAAEDEAMASGARIFNVPHLGIGRSSGELYLANTKGLSLARRTASASLGIGVVAKDGDSTKMGVDVYATLDPATIDPRGMARIASGRAVSLLGARSIPACEMPVLFDEWVSSSLLGIFAGAFVGENVQKGQSRLKGRENECIAAKDFTLATQPRMMRQGGSRLFDGEGVPTQPRALIQEGVLKGFLHNLESSQRAGTAPTGDAQRGYSGKVGAGFSNMHVPLGTESQEQLLRRYPRMLHVVKLEGASGCNAVSGEISIGVQGYLIENGVVVQAVDRITVSGNFFEMLQCVEARGNQYRPGLCSNFVPALLVSSMAIGG
jgi:PmbA protein